VVVVLLDELVEVDLVDVLELPLEVDVDLVTLPARDVPALTADGVVEVDVDVVVDLVVAVPTSDVPALSAPAEAC